MEKLSTTEFSKVIVSQMKEVNKYQGSQTREDIENNLSLLNNIGYVLTEDRYMNALAEFILWGKDTLGVDIVDWYVSVFRRYDVCYPNLTVSDVSYIEMLFKKNKSKQSRKEVYATIDEFYGFNGFKGSFSISIAEDICKQVMRG